jgi:hypothetical protein
VKGRIHHWARKRRTCGGPSLRKAYIWKGGVEGEVEAGGDGPVPGRPCT